MMKKTVIVGLSLVLLIATTNWTFAQQRYAGQTLRVATFGGTYLDLRKKFTAGPLERATGCKIEWVLGNPVDHLAKMIAARGGDPPFDVIYIGGIQSFQASELGLLEKLDFNLIPNAKKLLPEMVNEDRVTFSAGEDVLAYVPSKLKEAGVAAPTKMEDLFQPKLAGKIALPFVGGSDTGVIFIAALATDKGGSASNIKPALDRLKEANVSYYYRSTNDLEMRMLNGEVWAAFAFISRPFFFKSQGKDIDYNHVGPATYKATSAVSKLAIAKGTKQKELAHMYLNLALGLEAQYGMVEAMGYRPITDEAMKKCLESPNPNIRKIVDIPWKDVYNIGFPPDENIVAKNFDKWVDQFNREVGFQK